MYPGFNTLDWSGIRTCRSNSSFAFLFFFPTPSFIWGTKFELCSSIWAILYQCLTRLSAFKGKGSKNRKKKKKRSTERGTAVGHWVTGKDLILINLSFGMLTLRQRVPKSQKRRNSLRDGETLQGKKTKDKRKGEEKFLLYSLMSNQKGWLRCQLVLVVCMYIHTFV